MTADDWLPVGKVVGAQGLKGELRINPASEFPERFTEPGTRWLKARGKPPKEMELKSGRQLPGKSVFVVRFEGIDSREAAEALAERAAALGWVVRLLHPPQGRDWNDLPLEGLANS